MDKVSGFEGLMVVGQFSTSCLVHTGLQSSGGHLNKSHVLLNLFYKIKVRYLGVLCTLEYRTGISQPYRYLLKLRIFDGRPKRYHTTNNTI
jgi:hypothetical protein